MLETEVAAGGSRALQEQVWQRDLCTLCGACAGFCPYHVAYRGRMVAVDDCTVAAGRCYAACPRTGVDLDAASRGRFGAGYDATGIGAVLRVVMARASDARVRDAAQHGGTVTALVAFALREGLIDAAVLTSAPGSDPPTGVVARNEEDVLACSGSNFAAAPTLQAFNREAGRAGETRLGVVATPCQALALARMRQVAGENQSSLAPPALTIGLFCTWALDWAAFTAFLGARVALERVRKIDVPPPPAGVLRVDTDDGRLDFPLDDVRPLVRHACRTCADMTAEFADVSVGAAEGIDGWNTLLARTEAGVELLEAALRAGALEVVTLPEANREHLVEAAVLKRRRALATIVEASGRREDLLYLEPSRAVLQPLLAGDGAGT